MKPLLYICLWLGCLAPLASRAQQVQVQDQPPQGGGGRLQMLKVAFISERLNLTPQEAQVFWPLYNQYENELRAAKLAHVGDPLGQEEAELTIQRHYQMQFTTILGRFRTNRFYGLDREFTRILIQHVNPNRPRLGMGVRPRGF